jgi:membrane-associated PAP2 superfamily phosphatase
MESRTNQWQSVTLVSKLIRNYGKLLFIVMAVNGYLSGESDLEVRSSEKVCSATLYLLTRPGLATELSVMKQL